GARHVANKWLNLTPVQNCLRRGQVASLAGQQTLHDATRTRVDSHQTPTGVRFSQDQVVGMHQPTRGHVNQPAIEHILTQQHLARTPLEATKVQGLPLQLYSSGLQPEHQLLRHEQITTANAYLEAADAWVAAVGQAHDDILDSAQAIAGGVDHRAVHELTQQERHRSLGLPEIG